MGSGENPDPADVIEVDPSFSGPDPKSIADGLVGIRSSVDGLTRPWRAPRTLFLDRVGIRHVSHSDVSFAIRWQELSRVALEVHRSTVAPLVAVWLILWPADGETFAAGHPELDILRMADYDRLAWGIAVAERMADQADSSAMDEGIDTTMAALRRYAGALYDGTVENV
ncbi:hypothetical protein GCM10027613_02910 [Microlunatus endophyticus]